MENETLELNAIMVSKSRRWKGVWIPREVYLSNLTWTEKILWLEIDYLSENGDEECFAGNEYFANMLGIGEASVTRHISKLKRLGLIEETKFDGRKRYLRTNPKPFFNLEKRLIKMSKLPNQNEEAAYSKRLANNIDSNIKEDTFSKEKETAFKNAVSDSLKTKDSLKQTRQQRTINANKPNPSSKKQSSRNNPSVNQQTSLQEETTSLTPSRYGRQAASQQSPDQQSSDTPPAGAKQPRHRPDWRCASIIKIWNECPTTTHHLDTGTKKYRNIEKYLKQLMAGTFGKSNYFKPEWKNKMPEDIQETFDLEWTVDELKEAVGYLTKYSMDGYWPTGDKKNFKDLETLIYNPNTSKSLLIKAMANPPEPLCEQTPKNDTKYSEDVHIQFNQNFLIKEVQPKKSYSLKRLENSLKAMREWHTDIQHKMTFGDSSLRQFNRFVAKYADFLYDHRDHINLGYIFKECKQWGWFLVKLREDEDLY